MNPIPYIDKTTNPPLLRRLAVKLTREKGRRINPGTALILFPTVPGFLMAMSGVVGMPLGFWLTGVGMMITPVLLLSLLDYLADDL